MKPTAAKAASDPQVQINIRYLNGYMVMIDHIAVEHS